LAGGRLFFEGWEKKFSAIKGDIQLMIIFDNKRVHRVSPVILVVSLPAA
jgi:hypothetical protein